MTLSQIVEYWAGMHGMREYCYFIVCKDKLNGEFGHTYMSRRENAYTASIIINKKLPTNSVITEGVLWHEFAHCYTFYHYGYMKHDAKFWKFMLKNNVWLTIAPYVLFPITLYYLLR